MKIEYEIVKPDPGSSFRVLYQNTPAEDFVWQYHYHPEFEIVCVLGGSGTRHVGNHLSSYHDGDVVLIGSNIPHSGFGLNASDPHEEVVVQISPSVMNAWVGNLEEMKQVNQLLERAKHGIAFNGITKKDITQKLVNLVNMAPIEKYVNLLLILQDLAMSNNFELLNAQALLATAINKHKVRLQKIFTYVEQYYHQPIDINDVASLVNLSLPSFCNYFKKTTHTTFSEFVNRYRIQKACLLLLEDKTISEACFESGFNNITYFNKVFKQIIGKNPTLFRKEN